MASFSFVNILKTLKILLPETTGPRALTDDMVHHLMDLNRVCENYSHGAKSGPALESGVNAVN